LAVFDAEVEGSLDLSNFLIDGSEQGLGMRFSGLTLSELRVVVSLSSHPLDIYLYILSKNQPGFGGKSNIHTTLAHT
jgi:hypothetical protein